RHSRGKVKPAEDRLLPPGEVAEDVSNGPVAAIVAMDTVGGHLSWGQRIQQLSQGCVLAAQVPQQLLFVVHRLIAHRRLYSLSRRMGPPKVMYSPLVVYQGIRL